MLIRKHTAIVLTACLLISGSLYARDYSGYQWAKSAQDIMGAEAPFEIMRFVIGIKKALIKNDDKALADMCSYPIIAYMPDGPTRIESSEDLVAVLPVCLSEADRQEIIDMPLAELFVNYKGIALTSGIMWILTLTSGEFVITQINSGHRDSVNNFFDVKYYNPKGRVPIPNLKGEELKKAVAEAGIEVREFDEDYLIYMKDNPDYADGPALVYRADVNNDGQDEIMTVLVYQGSGMYSGITNFHAKQNGRWVKLDYVELYRKTYYPDRDMIDWNSIANHMNDPFLMNYKGNIYHGFDGQYFLWKNNRLTQVERPWHKKTDTQ